MKKEVKKGKINNYVYDDKKVMEMVMEGEKGVKLKKYFEEKIWQRIGEEEDDYWMKEEKGEVVEEGGINEVIREYERLGIIYMNEGRKYRGEKIVKEKWVND